MTDLVHSGSASIPGGDETTGATMLEGAARALSDHFKCEWETMRDADREMIRGYVRAVLMAVREPDGATVSAGRPHMPAEAEFAVKEIGGEYNRRYHHFVRTRSTHECVSPAGPFTAMIDAILADGEGR